MTEQKKEPRGAFYFCVEFKVPIDEDPKGWDSILATAASPWDESIFQAHPWGIWIRDDDDTIHWIQWDRITALTFEENKILSLPGKEHSQAAEEARTKLSAIQERAFAEFKQRTAKKGEDKKDNTGGERQ